MKTPINEGTTDTSDERKRFRFNRKHIDQDLAYLDEIAAQVDNLQTEAVAGQVTRGSETSTTASPEGETGTSSRSQVPTAVSVPAAGDGAAALLGTLGQTRTFKAQVAPPTTERAQAMSVDVDRIMSLLEEEAEAARMRIEYELRNAQEESDRVLASAESEAQRIRDHAQQQARVLLGEVEEIISESQQSAQDIRARAEADAADVREQAASTMAQAQEDGRRVIDTARREGENILAEQRRLATVRAQEALREQDRLKDQIRRLEERRRQVLESLEPLIDQLSQMIPAERNVVQMPGTRTHQG